MRLSTLTMGVLTLLALSGGRPLRAADEAVFDMKEISVLAEARTNEELAGELIEGANAFFDSDRSEEVKRYPPFKSPQPLYGTVTFGDDQFDAAGVVQVHLALDESSPQTAAPAESRSWLGSLFDRLLSRSPPTPQPKYDRLYVDVNRDLDLTNDPALVPMKDPAAVLPSGVAEERMRIFDYLTVSLDMGPELGSRPVRMLPVLSSVNGDFAFMTFVLPVARKGEVRVGNRQYTAYLMQQQTITGRFDRPFTRLRLVSGGSASRPTWRGGDMLCAMREEAGQLYRFRTTPAGDKLTVEPYRGDFGLLRVDAGGRKIDKLGAAGALYGKDPPTVVSVGKMIHWFSAEKAREQRLPVGDYWPMRLEVGFGRLQLDLSPNRYSLKGDRPEPKTPSFSIPIRKDKPCVLDFARKPTVAFVSPTRDAKIHPGDEIEIEAVLVDPVLDLMVTDIQDTTRKTRSFSITDDQGKPVEISQFASLNPAVTITDAAGKRVATGEMPFG